MRNIRLTLHLGKTIALHMWPWFFFFAMQGMAPSWELSLTALVLAIIAFTFYLQYEAGEHILLLVGIFIGLLVEVGLGMVYRTQYWNYASLFGVPYWLPLVWGYGFIVMRRIGNDIISLCSAASPR